MRSSGRGVATLAKTYKEIFADYLDYRGLEQRLVKLKGNMRCFQKAPR
jgi:hypothetical protein